MVKSKTDRAASAGGSFLGGIANNPAIVIIALVLGGLFIFRDKISDFVNNIKIPNPFENFEFPTLTNPFEDFKFPEFTNPFEDFKFPEFPDFTSIFQEQQDQFTSFIEKLQLQFTQDIPQPQKMVEDTGLFTQQELAQCQCGSIITQDAFGNVNQVCKVCDKPLDAVLPSQDPAENVPTLNGFVGGVGGGLLDFLGLTPAQEFALGKDLSPEQEAQIIVPPVDVFGFGGGGSFIGGVTTLGSNIVDTLSEVLQAFPNLTASQAANLLSENQGLTQTEFSFISPFAPSISSAGGDPEQILLNASGGFSGLTPEQIDSA